MARNCVARVVHTRRRFSSAGEDLSHRAGRIRSMARRGYTVILAVASALALWSAAADAAKDPPVSSAFAPVRLHATTTRVQTQCLLIKAIGLCPRRLPRPTIPFMGRGTLPPLGAEHFRYRDGGGEVVQFTYHYGAPWEPDSGPDWRQHLWRNRPCCFLHFDLYRRLNGPRHIRPGSRPATLGGKRGLLADAAGYRTACGVGSRGIYFCNHTAFAWRERGTWYIATLHYFGKRQTRLLLGRILRELAPIH